MLFQIFLGLLLLFMCGTLSRGGSIEAPNEGDCPRFVYESKLMERLVKLDLDKTAMRKKIADLEETCLPSPPKASPLIAVKIGLSAPKKVANGDRIIYDWVIANEGDAYDNQTGIFEAPVTGVYSFTVSACFDIKKWMVFTVVRNCSDWIIGRFLSGHEYNPACTNDYTTVKLDAGDKVWVEKIDGNTDDLTDDLNDDTEQHGWNSFSGNLIQPA